MEKHEEICVKTTSKKRKTFDMTKARVKVIYPLTDTNTLEIKHPQKNKCKYMIKAKAEKDFSLNLYQIKTRHKYFRNTRVKVIYPLPDTNTLEIQGLM